MPDINITLPMIAEALYFIFLFIFVVQAIFLGYHWFNYGTDKKVSLVALSLYLSGGAILLIALSVLIGKV